MAHITKQMKYPFPDVGLATLHDKVMAVVFERYDPNTLKTDLEYLQSEGKPIAQIARAIGTTRQNLYYWSRGEKCPNNTYYIELVHEWAEAVRKERQEQQQHGLRPVSSFVS